MAGIKTVYKLEREYVGGMEVWDKSFVLLSIFVKSREVEKKEKSVGGRHDERERERRGSPESWREPGAC